MFKRKIYNELLEWKKKYCSEYACMVEGARRVGKSTIVEEFARNEFETYIIVDFSKASESMMDVFKDIDNLDIFFLRLQAETGITLIEGKSVIIFDEVQLYPKARQAIKHLVKDGRYAYIETGSLISIKKNVKNIVIPSEEHKIQAYPMDYEEFLWATNGNSENIKSISEKNIALGNSTNRTLMRNFRIYMAVGGMPQAVNAYINKKSFDEIDKVKKEIISLYKEDLKKIDSSGRLSAIYDSVPSQLALGKKKFTITGAINKQKTSKDNERIFDLIDAKIVLPCYHVEEPQVPLKQTENIEQYKLYLSDIGLFTTMLFNDSENPLENIYKKLLSDKLDADLGYLYENVVAQLLHSKGYKLYYHTWAKENSTHYYEIDFLISKNNKVIPVEVKSSSVRNRKSITEFLKKHSNYTDCGFLLSQKDVSNDKNLHLKPVYTAQYIF